MASQAERIGAELRKQIAGACRAAALEIDKELRRATPVDTGHARRNWVPSVGAPHSGEVDDESAHAQGVADVLGYTLEAGPLWVANSAPYIRQLNYGHSKQAPAGFVERAVDIALQRVQTRYAVRGIDVSDLRRAHQDAVGAEGAGNLASAYSPFGGDE